MRRRKPDHSIPLDDLQGVLFTLAQRGWSVDQLAQATGGDPATLRRWLRGEVAISQELREKIAAVLAAHSASE